MCVVRALLCAVPVALHALSAAERRVYLSSQRPRVDLRAQHRQPDQAGHVGVLSLVDGDAQGGPPPLGVVCMYSRQ